MFIPVPLFPSAVTVLPLAEFKPIASSRAWVSIPNPNGLPLIATATSDKTVRVYSLINFALHSILERGHQRSIRSVAWKPAVKNTGTLCLATGSFDATMGIWRRQERGFDTEEPQIHSGADDNDNFELEISSNGEPKAVTRITQNIDSDSDTAEDDWEFSIVLEGHDSEVKCVSYSASGQWLASCSRDKSIWIWEDVGEEGEDEFETIAVLQDHTADVKCVCWRRDDGNGEVLASASYDDTIRFWKGDEDGEWSCISVLEGHDGTVWSLDWEPEVSMKRFESAEETKKSTSEGEEESHYIPPRTPRLVSSSADCTVRVWSKIPPPPPINKPSYINSGIPSSMRPPPAEETWQCTAILPKVHSLPIYSISWSKKSGRIVSTGGDGRVAIYSEEVTGRTSVGGPIEREWKVLGVFEGGHGPYEINHVTWCSRFDSGKRVKDEEIFVTTGDDGIVRAWAIDEILTGEEQASLPILGQK